MLIFTTGVLVELPVKVCVCAEELVIGDSGAAVVVDYLVMKSQSVGVTGQRV